MPPSFCSLPWGAAEGGGEAVDVEVVGLKGGLEAEVLEGLGGDGADAGEAHALEFLAVVGAEEGGEIFRGAAAGEGDPVDLAGVEGVDQGGREGVGDFGFVNGEVEDLGGAPLLEALAE